MSEGTQRRLAAILAADVASYSRLMGEDEAGTLTALRHLRTELFAPTVDDHNGTIVKSMGDGWLVEFTSVVDAVTCAIQVQERLAGNDTVKLRIGLHLGDITHQDEDIYGDGVNIAARLQEIAEPGALVISDIAWRSIDGKLSAAFTDLGEQDLKNIAKPITAYGWGMTAVAADGTVLSLPDKPSIAVLPFDNMSGDPEQEYFSDGIAEDIITELSRYPDFLVIARNSSFVYRGKSVNLKQVASDLGVRFVLEGSVRKAGSRVRVTAQMIDANTSSHIWAERFDRELNDIFAVQDELTTQIVSALGRNIQAIRLRQSRRKVPTSLDAYDKCIQASAKLSSPDRLGYAEARRLAREAIALDPDYALAYAIVAQTQLVSFTSRWLDDPEGSLDMSYKNAKAAVALDDHNFLAYTILGLCETWQRRHDLAIASLRHALALNPNEARTRAHFANVLMFAGQPEEALEQVEIAMRLDPHYPPVYPHFRGRAFFVQRQYDKAELAFSQAVTQAPGWPWGHLMLAAAQVALGKADAARAEVEAALKTSPELNLGYVPLSWPFREQSELDHLIDLLKRAGLPE